MTDFDIGAAKRRAGKVYRAGIRERLKKLVIPLAAHLGSLVTISLAWFARSGSFDFDIHSFWDWIVGSVVGLVAYNGVLLVIRALPATTELTVSRSQIQDLLAAHRSTAENSIRIVAGDLSWLDDDLASLKAIITDNPSIEIHIHYDRQRVHNNLVSQIAELDKAGVLLHPYGTPTYPRVRFTLIDKERAERTRAFTYAHSGLPPPQQDRQDHQFRWREFRPGAKILIQAFSTITELLETSSPDPIRIGISGLNNVGKTQLADHLRNSMRRRFSVRLVPDQFRVAGNGTTVEDSLVILFKELLAWSSRNGEDILIFDRTPIDNLLFLRLRAGNDTVYNAIGGAIADLAKSLDLLVFVRRSEEDFLKETTHVTGPERRAISDMFEQFFTTYDVPRREIFLQGENFDASLREAVESLSQEAAEIHHRRRISP